LTRKSGVWYGLRLTLNVHADDYIGMVAQSVGARIVVHNIDQFPLPESNGVYAAPGEVITLILNRQDAGVSLQQTSIGIHRTDYFRLPAPYTTQCYDTIPTMYLPYATLDAQTYPGCCI
jgi:hypothetical protein